VKVRVFDTEANNLYPAVTVCHCGVFTSLDGKEVDKFPPERQQDMLRFMDTCDVLIGHNVIGYDFPMLKKVCGYVFKGKVVDTLLMSRALNPKRFLPPHAKDRRAGPHSIYAWGVRVGVDKPEHEDWENYSPEMLHRCTEDVEINRLTYHALMKEAAESGGKWRDAFLLTFKLFQNLQEQEEYGWYVDKQKMLDNIVELEQLMQEIDDEVIPQLPNILEILEVKKDGQVNWVRKPFLKSGKPSESSSKHFGLDGCACIGGPYSRIGFRPVDLNSRNEVVSYLLKEGWEPLEWNFNDDGERTSPKLSKDDPFEGVEGEVGKLVSKRVQCRHRKSLVEGLLELVRDDGRISSSIAGMAVTGRMQHRGIVNIPAAKSFFGKQLREMFSCPPGKVLVSTDSDGNQLRQLAARMNDPAYIEALCNGDKDKGTDLHSVNQRAAGLASRDDAKTFIYGFLFGAGDAKIGKIVKGNSQRGKQLKEEFLRGLPALGALLERLRAEWRRTAKKRINKKYGRVEYFDGIITGLDGRPIKVSSEHQILVYLLQSDEAVQMAAAYNWTIAQLKKKYRYGEQVHVVCWMHDEYTFECDPDIADDVKKISEEGIAWAGRFYKIACPHVGQGKIGRNWYEIH
jgi:hypothetical protein